MTIRELVIKMGFDVDDKAIKDTDSKLANVAKTAGKIALGVGAALSGLGAIGLKTAMDMEQLNAQFTVMLGSGEKATEMTKEITKFASATPFAIKDLSQGAVTLLNFGITGEKILPTMKMLGDVAGNDSNKLKALALTFGQIQSTGKLMGGDLLQLINAGFNPLQVLSKSTGKSMAVLKDEMSKGAISTDMVTEAFRLATSEGGLFYKNMETQSKTLAGMLSVLKDNVSIMLMNIMTPFVPIVKDIVGQLTTLMEGDLGQLLGNMMNAFAPVLLQIIPLFAMLMSTIEPLASEILTDFMPTIAGLMNSMLIVVQILLPIFGVLLKTVSLLLKPVLWLLDGFFLMDKILGGGLTAFIMGIVVAFVLFTNTVKIMNIVIAIMNGLMAVNPFVWVMLAVIALIGLIGLLIKHWKTIYPIIDKYLIQPIKTAFNWVQNLINKFGVALGPVGLLLSGIMEIFSSWDSVVQAFKDGGIGNAILEIGKALLRGILMPLRSILEIASKIPGVGGFAKQGVQKIDDFISRYLKKTEVRAKETEKKVTQSEQKAISNKTTNNNVGMTNSFNINANGVDAGSIQGALQQSVRAMFQLELKKVLNNTGY